MDCKPILKVIRPKNEEDWKNKVSLPKAAVDPALRRKIEEGFREYEKMPDGPEKQKLLEKLVEMEREFERLYLNGEEKKEEADAPAEDGKGSCE